MDGWTLLRKKRPQTHKCKNIKIKQNKKHQDLSCIRTALKEKHIPHSDDESIQSSVP
jgi:hypothetical protein